MGRVYLVDGSNLLYRAYHAIRGFQTSRGLPTQAVYGFTSMALRLEKEEKPDFLAVVFDPPGPTRKHTLYSEYKAQRERPPEDLIIQIPYVHRVLEAMGIPVLIVPGIEADDLIGTLAKKALDRGDEVTIVTGDKDFYQLVGPGLKLLDTMRDLVTGPDEVFERMGVKPEQVVDLLAITGDKVDNIPGVPGVGQKLAAQLLGDYGGLESLIAHADELGGKRGEAFRENLARIRANVPLVTIETDIDVGDIGDNLDRKPVDAAGLASLFRELEFHKFLRDLGLLEVPVVKPAESEDAARTWVDEIIPSNWVSVVFTPEGPFLCDGAGPVAPSAPVKIPPGSRVVGHGLKAYREEWESAGLTSGMIEIDTELAGYMIFPGRRSYDLVSLAEDRELSLDPKTGEGLLTLALRLKREMEEKGLWPLFREVEIPLIGVLARMEAAGVKVDREKLSGLSLEFEGRLKTLETEMFELAGGEFNPQSPKQLAEILFQKLGLAPVRKTAGGSHSTDASVLEELSVQHKLPAVIIEHRGLSKLKSSFIDALPKLVADDGRIHTVFQQTVAATGRLSSSNPNLQNIPIRGEEGKRIREAFIAEPGYLLLSADYSQVELRILAHLSCDDDLVSLFASGRDIHSETAARLFDVGPLGVTTEMRRQAKTVNFGIIYGISPFGLAKQLGVSQSDAKKMIDRYMKRFPGVFQIREKLIAEAKEKGYSTTLFGRTRPIPELKSKNRADREFGERLAVNSPIQGSAADIIKRAMLMADDAMRSDKVDARLTLQVHDELVLEVAEKQVEKAREILVEAMEGAAKLKVRLKVEAGWGHDWYRAHGG